MWIFKKFYYQSIIILSLDTIIYAMIIIFTNSVLWYDFKFHVNVQENLNICLNGFEIKREHMFINLFYLLISYMYLFQRTYNLKRYRQFLKTEIWRNWIYMSLTKWNSIFIWLNTLFFLWLVNIFMCSSTCFTNITIKIKKTIVFTNHCLPFCNRLKMFRGICILQLH